MTALLLPGLLSGIGILFLCMKVGMKKICGYDVAADIILTSILCFIFYGTYSGMMAGIIGGILVSISLWAYKNIWGYEKLVRVRGVKFEWKYFAPIGSEVGHGT